MAPGTNLAAVSCPEVDLLAHPGLLTPEEAELAARHGIFLELSGRGGHSFGNGRVAQEARRALAKLLVNSDAHAPKDLLSEALARHLALGAGLSEGEAETALIANPQELLAAGSRGA